MDTNEFNMRAARALRQEQTEAEAKLWELLRNRNFEDIKFRRQHPIKDYIVDFFSFELQLIIELDGGYHQDPEQKEKDTLRDLDLKALGYNVLRYTNETVLDGKEQHIYNDILTRKKTYKPVTPLSAGEGLGVRVLATKKLKLNQRELLLNAGLSFVEYDAITISQIPFELPKEASHIIITSQNGAKAFLQKLKSSQLLPSLVDRGIGGDGLEMSCYAVGKKTTVFLEENGLKVAKTAQNAADLARFIAKNHKKEHFYYYCGNRRRDQLPTILTEAQVSFQEVITYETSLNHKSFDQNFDGLLFFSPSGVEAFAQANPFNPPLLKERVGVSCFCIGETTAAAALEYTNNVIVANDTTIESTIAKAVKTLKK